MNTSHAQNHLNNNSNQSQCEDGESPTKQSRPGMQHVFPREIASSEMLRFASHFFLAVTFMVIASSCSRAQTPNMKFPADREKLASEMEDIASQHIHMPPLPVNYAPDRYINVL